MRIGEVIGTVTLNRCHGSFDCGTYRLVIPLNLDNLRGAAPATAEPIVAYDALGAGLGSRIAISEGAEAAQPYRPNQKPIDAYNAAILDTLDVR